MPRTYKKRRYRKRKQRIPRNALTGGFPQSKLVKLRYVEEISINGALSAITQQQFRCNSVYDPYYSGVGHQPMNFDRWAAIYDHYTVMSSTCKVTPVIASPGNVIPGYVGVLVTTDSAGTTTLSNVTSLFENKLHSHKWVVAGNATATPQGYVGKGLKSYFNAKRLFGVVNPQDGGAYGALVTANPARDAYFNVYLASVRGNTPGDIQMLVEIEYTVLFDELTAQTQN